MRKLRSKTFPWLSLSFLFIGFILGSSIVVVLSSQSKSSDPSATTIASPAGEPTAGPIVGPTPKPVVDVTRLRPYSDDSPWNTQIGPDPKYDPHSDEMVATIGLTADGRIGADSGQYSYTVYFVDESTPRSDIPCTRYKCTIYSPDQTLKTQMLTGVPIPPAAQPSSGTDMQMIIIDKSNYNEYNLWGVERTDTGWTTRNGSVYNILLDGMPVNFGSRGAGVPYLAGLVRPWEIEQGHIDHAVAFAYSYPAKDRCVFPASKTDGNSSLPYAIPEGARLQLDPSLTDDDFDRMGLNRTGKIIAHALQKYGMILINFGGHPKINVENLADNPNATVQWADPPFEMNNKTLAGIPYTAFRVIALPEAYWNGSTDGPTHGKCYAYPSSEPSPQ